MTGSVSVETGVELKRAGQEQSGEKVTPEQRAAFMAAIDALPPGAAFTANTLRPQWDRAGIPESARAHLMYAACAEGRAEHVTFDVGGETIAMKVPSTGRSAKRAFVCLYRRPLPHREGR